MKTQMRTFRCAALLTGLKTTLPFKWDANPMGPGNSDCIAAQQLQSRQALLASWPALIESVQGRARQGLSWGEVCPASRTLLARFARAFPARCMLEYGPAQTAGGPPSLPTAVPGKQPAPPGCSRGCHTLVQGAHTLLPDSYL